MAVPEQLRSLQNRAPQAKRKTGPTSAELVRAGVHGLQAKKGVSITVMDMRSVSGVADFFVICTGGSDVQIKALSTEVQEQIRNRLSERPWHVEGLDSLQWVLIDYADVVVHVMTAASREFYGLERLWGDAPIEDVADEDDEPRLSILSKQPPARSQRRSAARKK